jgi:hypothetical protein
MILAGTGILVILLVVGLILVIAVPTIHDPPSSEDLAVIDVAETFEQNFASELTRVRPDQEPWGVRIREDDLNAWLWTRLPAWIAHARGASAFGAEPMLQVRVNRDRIMLSTDSVAVAFEPRVLDEQVQIRSTSGSTIGRLPLPQFMFDQLIESIPLFDLGDSLLDGEHGGLLRKPDAWVLPTRFGLHDGRRLELLEIQLDEGEAVLVFRTLAPDSTQP